MKKIYVCQASGTENQSFVSRNVFSLIIILLCIIYIIISFLDFNNEFIDENMYRLAVFYLFLIGSEYNKYVSKLPHLQIDSLYNLLIYLGKGVHYSTKLENIHHLSIAEDGIILHSDKQVKIPFSEFEKVNLTSFANSMNKAITTNVNFYKILNEENKIQGFNYLNENNTKKLRTLMQGNFLTKNIKELQMLKQKHILTESWWWSHNLSIILLTSMAIIFSIIELSLWFFN